MSWAELRDLVQALPEDSATKAVLAGDVDGRRWSSDTFLLAAVYNSLLMLNRTQHLAHLKGPPPELQPIRPPALNGDEDEEAQAEANSRAEKFLDQFSPGTAPGEQADIDEWQARIAELDASHA